MSFLAGRLAATEGAFFNQHSKQAAIALKQKLKPSTPSSAASNSETVVKPSQADVLAEILRHSLPIAPTAAEVEASNVRSAPARSSLAASLKSVLNRQTVPEDGTVQTRVPSIMAVDHLASFPQTTLGRKKWNIDAPDVQMIASTANETRVAKDGVFDQKTAMEEIFFVTRAVSMAKAFVYVGSIIAATVTVFRHDIKSLDDLRTKVREFCTTRAEEIKYRLEPLKSWVEQKSESWKIEEARRRAIGADYAKPLGLQQALEDGKSKGR